MKQLCTYCATKDMLTRLDATNAQAIRAVLPHYAPCTCVFDPPTPDLLAVAKTALANQGTADIELLRSWAVQLASYINGFSND